jgi:hypothetical protein
MNYGLAHRLLLDFLKTYVYDFYLDSVKNPIISNYNEEFSQESIHIL